MVTALSMGEPLLKVGATEVKVEKNLPNTNMRNTKTQASAVTPGLLKTSGKDPRAARPAETDRRAILRGSRPHGWARNAVVLMAHQAQTPSPGESDALSMHSWLKADRQGRSRTATASPKTSKSSTTSVKCSHWVQMCAGCSHMLLVCMRQVWPTTASSHQPPPAPAEPRPGALNKRKEPDETWTRDPGNDNRNPERLVAHLLWHTDCHDPLDLSHQHEEKSLMAWAAVPSKAVVLLLTFCLLLLPLWESVIVLCFVVRYFMSILVL